MTRAIAKHRLPKVTVGFQKKFASAPWRRLGRLYTTQGAEGARRVTGSERRRVAQNCGNQVAMHERLLLTFQFELFSGRLGRRSSLHI